MAQDAFYTLEEALAAGRKKMDLGYKYYVVFRANAYKHRYRILPACEDFDGPNYCYYYTYYRAWCDAPVVRVLTTPELDYEHACRIAAHRAEKAVKETEAAYDKTGKALKEAKDAADAAALAVREAREAKRAADAAKDKAISAEIASRHAKQKAAATAALEAKKQAEAAQRATVEVVETTVTTVTRTIRKAA